MSEDEERQYIRAAIAAVDQATGTRPVGWSGPDFQETPRTPDLLAAEGIRYVCDWGNDEQPYKMTPQTGELYSLGVNAYLDDNYIHLHGRRTINEVNRLWREWFDGLYADGATTGRVLVLHLHPWIMGQPCRTVVYTPPVANSPNILKKEIGKARCAFDMRVEDALSCGQT